MKEIKKKKKRDKLNIQKPKPTSLRKQPGSKYQELYVKFLNKGVSQSSWLILRRISANQNIPESFRNQPLLRQIESIACELFMNEFEITLFGIYLETFGWSAKDLDLQMILFFCGLLAKKKLNQNIEIFADQFESIFPEFNLRFARWEKKVQRLSEVTSMDINAKYNLYSTHADANDGEIVNYNYIVDEILRGSISYNLTTPTVLESIMKDLDLQKIYQARQLNQKIVFRSNKNKSVSSDIANPVLRKLDSVFEVIEPKSIRTSFSLPNEQTFYSNNFVLDRIDSLCTEFLNLSRHSSVQDGLRRNSGFESRNSFAINEKAIEGNIEPQQGFTFIPGGIIPEYFSKRSSFSKK